MVALLAFLLDVERRTAAAGAADVRVSELEAGTMGTIDEIDLRSIEVLKTQRIDEEIDAVRLEPLVQVGGCLLEIQVILKPRAAPANDAEPQTLPKQALRSGNFLNLFRS